MLGHPALNFIDGDPAIGGAEQILQHVLHGIEGDVATDQIGMSNEAVQRALKLADIRGDLVREELGNLLRHVDFQLVSLRLQDAEAQLIAGRVNIGHQTPAEAGTKTLFQTFEAGRALVGGNDDLAVLVNQRIESMEELFLGALLAADELHIIDHQDIDAAELLLERHGVLEAERADKLVHELLGAEIQHLAFRGLLMDCPADGVHQVGFTEADTAIEEQRVERHIIAFGHPAGSGMGQFVRLADNKIVEGEAWIELGQQSLFAVIQ